MRTQLTSIVRTLNLLLVISDFAAHSEQPRNIRTNVLTVRRIKIRQSPKGLVKNSPGYQNITKSGFYLDKLSPERRARCRRYAQQYYDSSGYPITDLSTDYNKYSGYYVPPAYIPPKCYTFCVECPTSSCRRRCPLWPETPSSNQGYVQAQIIISPPDATKFPTKPNLPACNCDPNGSKYSSCDPTNGNCVCKPHYEGRTCDVCKPGYWKTLKKDCIKCHCNEYGAIDSFCGQETGQCNCKPGLTGQNCDRCLPNFYGTAETGCIECERCTKKGHVCGKGGKCVCPVLTIGKECERCSLNSWGYEAGIGCKACNCSYAGSSSLQCERNSGICPCKRGYEGSMCDRCSFGYHGYPNCKKCMCSLIGTLETDCQNADCQCNEDGSCNCKENVVGSKCNKCKESTFGLSKEHSKGCKECFCFGRSDRCTDTRYNWDKIRFEKGIENNEPISLDTISLPDRFMGDLTTSYDGYLSVNGSGGKFSVFLTGNGISLKSDMSSNELRLNEKYWRVTSGRMLPGCQSSLTRECFLLVLQKVTSVIIQGQDMEIVEVLLDSAKPYIPYNRTSHSIEMCECPPQYTGLSCQNPNKGYYRYYPTNDEVTETTWMDEVIGVARPCDCNGRSSQCDSDTGHCKGCLNNTSGFHCELCDTGYYQDYQGNCQACLCPTETDNNAESCVAKKHGFVCHCRMGYTGSKCESCKDSYYRDPNTNKCVPCNCNYYGSYSSICNPSGVCNCRPGFHGDKCNQCKSHREYIKDGVCVPCDECTQILFNDIDRLYKSLDVVTDLFKDGLSPPWKVLDSLRARYKLLNKTFQYKFQKGKDILKIGNISDLENRVFDMDAKVGSFAKLSDENLKHTEGNRMVTTAFLDELNEMRKEISDLIKRLREFGQKHVDAEGAVKEAVEILFSMQTDIQARIDAVETYNRPILRYCKSVSDSVYEFYRDPPILPCDDLNKFNEKLDELETLAKQALEGTSKASFLNDQNRIAMLRLKDDLMRFELISQDSGEDMQYANKIIKDIRGKMSELETLIEDMDKFEFSEWNKLEERIYDLEEQTPLLEDLVHKASEHARQLKKIVVHRIGALNFTKDETEKIKGITAYNEIIEGIASAMKTVNESRQILGKVMDMMYPTTGDTLIDKANLAHSKSDRLKHRITNMKDVSSQLSSKRKDVENLKVRLIDNGRYNNELNRQLQAIDTQLTSKDSLINKLHQAIDNSSRITDRMRQIEKDISNFNITIRYDLLSKKSKYDDTRAGAEDAIRQAEENVRDMIRNVDSLLKSGQGVDGGKIADTQEKLDKVTFTIADLQNKIKYAKQAAESINVPLGLSNCMMTYGSPLSQAEVFRSLSMTFKCNNCLLFKWDRRGFSVKTKNGRAVVNYKVGDQTYLLKTSKEGNLEYERTLYIERVGSFLRIKYQNETTWNSVQISGETLVVDPSDLFEVGDGQVVHENFANVNKLAINDQNIGLWKFTQTSGHCKGQPRVYARELEKTRAFYSGNGYKKYSQADAKPARFSLRFQFATFDENSLIYLAQASEDPSAFIALTLEEGHLRLNVQHNNGASISLVTDEKFNNGTTIQSIGITMKYGDNVQNYTLEVNGKNYKTSAFVEHKAIFKIKKSVHYVGGVPPTFDARNFNFSSRSFLGFLTPLSLSGELISSGVTQKEGELELHKAWFKGDGLLRLKFALPKSKSGQNLDSVSFILRPVISNAAILDINNFGTITLSNRSLQVNLVDGEHYLVDKKLSLHDYNVVSIRFTSSNISFVINGKEINMTRSRTENIFKANKIELIIGYHEGFQSYQGGISELNINNVDILLSSKTVASFVKVEIGREEPLVRPHITLKGLKPNPPVTHITMTNTMQSTQGCATTANYRTDPTAINFGDQPDSYIKVKTNFWRKDFIFEFQFRTLYPNGLLFIAVGSTTQQQYNFLQLKDGIITFNVKGKRTKLPKNWPLTFPKKVDDGKWHTLKLVKKNNKKLQMWLDDEPRKPLKLPKTNIKSEFFFGNVPSGYISNSELKERITPFRGCINNMKINNEPKLLGKNTSEVTYSNIRQCFQTIEEGAYFGGDAYAIYKEGFRINKILDLSFEFRTAEQNGILLTVSNEGNYPALSVELQNGAVVLTVDLGNGFQSNVTNNLDSDFALCNNMWHKVSAMYSSSELTVNVDGIRKSWVQSDINSIMDEIDAPLYVGGLPDDAAVGTLKTRENFKGCLRALAIENELKDWAEMEELNGVLVNSCPAETAN